MRKLFIYYSLTGSGEEVAKVLEGQGYEIRRVYEKKKMPKSFFFRVFVGGFRAGIKAKAKLIDYDPNVSDYEQIVIGSPVWNGRFPPAINAVLKQTSLQGQDLTFLFYSGSGEAPKATLVVNRDYPDAHILYLQEPKKYPQELEKLKSL